MTDVVLTFGWGVAIDEATEELPEVFGCSFGGVALQLGIGLLDWVVVRAVRWQVGQLGTRSFGHFSYTGYLMVSRIGLGLRA